MSKRRRKQGMPAIAASPPMPTVPRRGAVLPALLCLAAILATAMIYWAGLPGPFLYDDFIHIVSNPGIQIPDLSLASLWQAAVSSHTGQVWRPVSMASFGMTYAVAGLHPWAFKFTNLLIHLLNAVLAAWTLYLLLEESPNLKRLCPRPLLVAVLASLIWAIQPLQVSTVLYVVQRMTLLSATFTLASLLAYVHGRARLDQSRREAAPWFFAAFAVFLPLAVLSKENGALAIGLIWLIETVAFRLPGEMRPLQRWLPTILFGVCCLGAATVLLWRGTGFSGAFEERGITGWQRVLTESRALWWYVGQTYVPRLGEMSLSHDTWVASRSLWQPALTAPAMLAWAAATACAVRWYRRVPIFSLGVGWFLIGHSMEAGPVPLALVFEHRNYLPSLGLVLMVLAPLAAFLSTNPAGNRTRGVAVAASAVVLLALGGLTARRAYDWRSADALTQAQLKNYPDSFTALLERAEALEEALPEQSDPNRVASMANEADQLYAKAADMNGSLANPLFGRIRLRYLMQAPVPDEFFADFERLMRESPLKVMTYNAAVTLVRCPRDDYCKIPEPWIARIAFALIDNPGASIGYRAQMLAYLADYYGIVRRDNARALDLSKRAVALDDKFPPLRMFLARWLAASGDEQQALATLDEMDRMDRYGVFRRYSDGLRGAIRQHQPPSSREAPLAAPL